MIISEVKEKNVWENFLLNCEEKTFLQSFNWGEFQKLQGNKIWRLGGCDNEDLNSVFWVVKMAAKRVKFLLIQHGPVMTQNCNSKIKTFEILLMKLKEIAKEENCSFIRIASLFERNEENKNIFKDLGFKEAPMHANAYEATWKLDLTPPEEELLKNMRKTTRYLIRQAEKNPDIVIERSERLSDARAYQRLNQEVAQRQKFVPFSFEYIKNEFEVFSKDGQTLWLFGKYKGEIVSAVLVVFWSGIGFYHQAASDSKHAKLSIPYFLQWEAIREAKKRGCLLYDFWGYTDPKTQPKHPWAGPTLFKMGFGGRAYEYVKTQDFPISKKYYLTYIFEKLRTFRRFGFGRTLNAPRILRSVKRGF